MSRDSIIRLIGEEAFFYIQRFADIGDKSLLVQKNTDSFNLEILDKEELSTLININKLNDIHGLNKFFSAANKKLANDGLFIGFFESKHERKKRLLKKYLFPFNYVYLLLDFIFKRVFRKIYITRKLMFFLTAGRNKVLSKAEMLGRLVFCGFEIIEDTEINNMCFFVCRKKQAPLGIDSVPKRGLLFSMKRIGYKGEVITVHKFRTMHRYAEYIQDYIFKNNKLRKGGKFKDDYRITEWGKILRIFWIDEIPMILNLIKGNIKLVGVRPLSPQYLSLYPDDFQKMRYQFKPGLVPPFYVDLPETLDQIIDSEKKYLEAYQRNPWKTDLKYFFKATNNILFRKVRSN